MPLQPAGDLAAAAVSYSAGYTEQFQLRRRIIPCMGAGNGSNVRIVRLVMHTKKKNCEDEKHWPDCTPAKKK